VYINESRWEDDIEILKCILMKVGGRIILKY
jgi:hypothetical protein